MGGCDFRQILTLFLWAKLFLYKRQNEQTDTNLVIQFDSADVYIFLVKTNQNKKIIIPTRVHFQLVTFLVVWLARKLVF